MSAIKHHLEELTDKHGYYAACSGRERQAYTFAVLDCNDRLLKHMHGRSLEEVRLINDLIGDLQEMWDELKSVNAWQPVTY